MEIDLNQLKYYHHLLRGILTEMESETGLIFRITSQYRIDDTGVHGTLPLRGTDTSCRVQSIGDAIAEYVNKRWQYDPARPEMKVCRCHKTIAGKLHLHWQVHDNTKFIG